MIGRSAKTSFHSENPKISEEIVNTIQNSLLKYQFQSRYFIQITNKKYLNIVLFLWLYRSSMEKTKKIKAAFVKISEPEMKEFQDVFFAKDAKLKPKYLNIAQIASTATAKFSYHQELIKKNASFFQELSINWLFEHQDYKNKIQVRQFRDGSLKKFNEIAVSESKSQVKNDIILINNQEGYLIALYSSQFFHLKNQQKSQTITIVTTRQGKTTRQQQQSQSSQYFSSPSKSASKTPKQQKQKQIKQRQTEVDEDEEEEGDGDEQQLQQQAKLTGQPQKQKQLGDLEEETAGGYDFNKSESNFFKVLVVIFFIVVAASIAILAKII